MCIYIYTYTYILLNYKLILIMKKEMLLTCAPALTDSSRPVLPQQQSFAMILQSPTQHSMTHNNVCASGLKMTGNLPPAATRTQNKCSQKKTHMTCCRLFTHRACFPECNLHGRDSSLRNLPTCADGSSKHVACIHVLFKNDNTWPGRAVPCLPWSVS